MGGLGFRDIDLFNLSLLARQAWRIIHTPSTLSAKILKAKYYPASSFLEAELGSRPSQIWRSIIEGRGALEQGLIRGIGTGEETRIWDQNWLPRSGLIRPIACLAVDRPARVAELIDPTSAKWKEDKVRATFLPVDANVILKIPLCTRRVDDFWAWGRTNEAFSQ